jgi:hypothetical protein
MSKPLDHARLLEELRRMAEDQGIAGLNPSPR